MIVRSLVNVPTLGVSKGQLFTAKLTNFATYELKVGDNLIEFYEPRADVIDDLTGCTVSYLGCERSYKVRIIVGDVVGLDSGHITQLSKLMFINF